MSILSEASKNIINLPRYAKRIIALIIDIGLCVLCTWIAFYLRLEEFIKINDVTILAVLISIFLAIPIFWLSGLYKTMIRFAGSSIILTAAVATLAYGLLYFAVIGIYGIQEIPRSIGIIQPMLLFSAISISRVIIRYFFINTFPFKNSKNKKNVLIYGAGSAGRQLLASLENNPEMKMVGFLDDNQQFHNQTILGQIVYDPLEIEKLINLKNIDLVLLALPSINRIKRNQIIENLNKNKVTVKTLPSIQDIVDGRISVSDIKDLTIEDLLNREQVKPNLELLNKNINSKVVLVTGAGGSIGSELCRQIIKLNPKKLLLLELNEFALYKISEELKNLTPNLKILPLLINVQNSLRLNDVFKAFKVDTVYHTAAYKHVSLVEENICEGVKNNVFGTLSLAQISIKYNVSNFVLISSDKAVRPTNIMGASKRLAEICVQALYSNQDKHTKFAIVRFGNVLQSSGSVIPKFKKQIREGGPVTLTHPDVTRYFMSITEASELVIQAGAMSNGCEVFVLNMGESIKIKELILKMIKLSGLTLKDARNSEGDIEVKVTGLRPGEKLFEELLLGDNPQKTSHEKIQKAQDPYIPFNQLKTDLNILSILLDENKVAEVKDKLSKLIPSYQSNAKIVDHLYDQQLNSKYDTKSKTIIKDQENKVISIKIK
jgi:FlaA1/EpsC-like NDP-sugar epimerase